MLAVLLVYRLLIKDLEANVTWTDKHLTPIFFRHFIRYINHPLIPVHSVLDFESSRINSAQSSYWIHDVKPAGPSVLYKGFSIHLLGFRLWDDPEIASDDELKSDERNLSKLKKGQ